MIDGLSTIPSFVCNEPEGAFYLFPKVSAVFGKHHNGQTINDATDLAMYLLSEAHVATVAGDAFGAPEYLRLSYATSNELLSEAIVRIKSAIENLAS
jgi:aspartate aminotransferase